MQEAIRVEGSCGFLLVAIDSLGRINEAYGYDIADEVIGVVAKRLRGRMRGDDVLGRFSGNKFGIILQNCTPEELSIAAERFLTGMRDDVVMTTAGPVSVTGTIGGVTARAMPAMSTRCWRALRKRSTGPRKSGPARSWPITPISNVKRSGAPISAPPTRSSPR